MICHRVRTLDCDGRKIGKVWAEEFYGKLIDAEILQSKIIEKSDSRNPKYPFEKDIEGIEGIYGYCNWQFGIMVTVDRFVIN